MPGNPYAAIDAKLATARSCLLNISANPHWQKGVDERLVEAITDAIAATIDAIDIACEIQARDRLEAWTERVERSEKSES